MSRPKIPLPMKRRIRQRCFFGCVMCGAPIFDYEHMTGFTQTGHDESDITLLCPEHHREKTSGRLHADIVRQADRAPFNSGKLLSSGHELYFSGDDFDLDLGNLNVHWDHGLKNGVAVSVDGAPFIGVSFVNGLTLFSLDLRDRDNRTLVKVTKGVLRYCPSNWDIIFEGTLLSIRTGHGSVVFEMKLCPPNCIKIIRADMWLNGVNLGIGKSTELGGLDIRNISFSMSNFRIEGAGVALELGDFQSPRLGQTMFRAVEIPRFYGGPVPPIGAFFSP